MIILKIKNSKLYTWMMDLKIKLLKNKQYYSNRYSVVKVRHRKNVAQSVAIQTGSNLSKYENLIFMDGDLQNDPKDIIKLVKVFEEGSDLTIGWRKNRQDPFFQKLYQV